MNDIVCVRVFLRLEPKNLPGGTMLPTCHGPLPICSASSAWYGPVTGEPLESAIQRTPLHR